MSNDHIERFKALHDDYKAGMYNGMDFQAMCLHMLTADNAEALWNLFPEWLRQRIKDSVRRFSEDDEIVTFGADPVEVKKHILFVKTWLSDRGA